MADVAAAAALPIPDSSFSSRHSDVGPPPEVFGMPEVPQSQENNEALQHFQRMKLDVDLAIEAVSRKRPKQQTNTQVPDFFLPSDRNVEVIRMDFVSRDSLKEQDLLPQNELGASQQQRHLVIPTTTLLSSEQLEGNYVPEIQTHGILQFVVMASKKNTTDWFLPPIQLFFDLVSVTECNLLATGSVALRALKWASQWGDIGLLGLATKEPDLVGIYRTAISSVEIEGHFFATIPRDILEPKNLVTVLLQDTHRHFRPELLATAIIQRNPELRGSIRAIRVKTFGSEDKTLKGKSKQGWRVVVLEGDLAFMASLRLTTDQHRFHLGAGHVYIRGGIRKDPEQAKSKTTSQQTNHNRRSNSSRSRSSQHRGTYSQPPHPQGENTRHPRIPRDHLQHDRKRSTSRNRHEPQNFEHRPARYNASDRSGRESLGAIPKNNQPVRGRRSRDPSHSYESP
jgi:hypothetical protein